MGVFKESVDRCVPLSLISKNNSKEHFNNNDHSIICQKSWPHQRYSHEELPKTGQVVTLYGMDWGKIGYVLDLESKYISSSSFASFQDKGTHEINYGFFIIVRKHISYDKAFYGSVVNKGRLLLILNPLLTSLICPSTPQFSSVTPWAARQHGSDMLNNKKEKLPFSAFSVSAETCVVFVVSNSASFDVSRLLAFQRL